MRCNLIFSLYDNFEFGVCQRAVGKTTKNQSIASDTHARALLYEANEKHAHFVLIYQQKDSTNHVLFRFFINFATRIYSLLFCKTHSFEMYSLNRAMQLIYTLQMKICVRENMKHERKKNTQQQRGNV